MEILTNLLWILTPAAIIIIALECVRRSKKEKIYMYKTDSWLDVNQYPIPEDIRYFLATDGKNVKDKFRVEWGPNGKVLFDSYDKIYITHWMPYPEPPKRK